MKTFIFIICFIVTIINITYSQEIFTTLDYVDLAKYILNDTMVHDYFMEISGSTIPNTAKLNTNDSNIIEFIRNNSYSEDFLVKEISPWCVTDSLDTKYCVILQHIKGTIAHCGGLDHAYLAIFDKNKNKISNTLHIIGDRGEYKIYKGQYKDYILFITMSGGQGYEEWKNKLCSIDSNNNWISEGVMGNRSSRKKIKILGDNYLQVLSLEPVFEEGHVMPQYYKTEISCELKWDSVNEKFIVK